MDFKKYPRSSTSNFTPLAFRNKDLAHSTIFTSKPLVLVLIESRHKKRPLLEDCSSSQGSRLNGNTGIPFKFLTYSSMPRRFRKFSVQCLRKLSLCIWDLVYYSVQCWWFSVAVHYIQACRTEQYWLNNWNSYGF